MKRNKLDNSLEGIDFSFIRYANCWEDADVVIDALQPNESSKILSIGSAGDNSFSLLASSPREVVAVDINPAQTYLIELKKSAIKLLNRNQVLAFLGFTHSTSRLQTFECLKQDLSQQAHKFWSQQQEEIDAGVIHHGKFEKYFYFFSRYILPLIHKQNNIAKLVLPKSALQQNKFYAEVWSNHKWRLLFLLFFSKTVMGRFGRDKRFFEEVNQKVGKVIFGRAEKHLKNSIAQRNEFLHYILFREFPTHKLPHYLREENFQKVKSNIDKLTIKCASFSSVLESSREFTHFNLSDIFEYLSSDNYIKTVRLIYKQTNVGAKFVYWNLLVPRSMSDEMPGDFYYMKDSSEDLAASDKGFFYAPVIVEQRT